MNGMDERRLEALLAQVAGSPSPDEEELRALARTAASTPRVPTRGTPHRLRSALAVGTALLLGVGVGVGVSAWRTAEGTAGTNFVGVGLLPAEGWTVVQFEAAGPAASTAIAANVPLDPDDPPGVTPHATLSKLPERGVVVVSTFGLRGEAEREPLFPLRRLPLKFADAEEEAAASPPGYRLRAAVGAYNVDAAIYFGGRPSAASVAAVQRQLNRLFAAAERVTIATRERVLRKGQTFVNLFGSVSTDKADEVVTLEGKECGPHAPSFVPWGIPPVTRAGGGWSITTHIRTTTSYRAKWAGATSAPVTVWARPWVRLRSRGAGRYEAEAGGHANFWSKRVQIQLRNPRLGTWTTLRTVVLDTSRGTFAESTFTLKLPRGRLIRAVLPLSQARPCYLAGFSVPLRT
jgi:hypothetical protein